MIRRYYEKDISIVRAIGGRRSVDRSSNNSRRRSSSNNSRRSSSSNNEEGEEEDEEVQHPIGTRVFVRDYGWAKVEALPTSGQYRGRIKVRYSKGGTYHVLPSQLMEEGEEEDKEDIDCPRCGDELTPAFYGRCWCDECRDDIVRSDETPTFRCEGCDYDVCLDCADIA